MKRTFSLNIQKIDRREYYADDNNELNCNLRNILKASEPKLKRNINCMYDVEIVRRSLFADRASNWPCLCTFKYMEFRLRKSFFSFYFPTAATTFLPN